MLALSLIMAIIPTIVILAIVYNTDKEKEPTKLLLSLFGVGILSCFLTVVISFAFDSVLSVFKIINEKSYIYIIFRCFLQVALIEELSKWIFCYSIGWNNKEFNHQYDAIVYCVFVSLGFATFENVLYSLHFGLKTSILRGVISVPSHAAFAVIMGYYISKAKISKNAKDQYLNMIYSIIIPVLLHGVFDLCLTIGQKALIIFLLLVVYLYIDGFKKISEISKLKGFRTS